MNIKTYDLSNLKTNRKGLMHIQDFFNAYNRVLNKTPPTFNIKKTDYTIDLESLIKIPCHVYAKDKQGVHILCNDNQAKNIGFSKGDEVIGKKDEALCWGQYANILRDNDQKVLKTGDTNLCYETVVLLDGVHRVTFNCKIPLYDKKEKIVGIFGISILPGLHQLSSDIIHPRSSLNFKITKRESDCLHHLIYGKSAKQIAKILNISHRTVEEHLLNMRKKLNCFNKSQLIEIAIKSGFLQR